MQIHALSRVLVLFTVVAASACTTGNIGGDVSRSPVAAPPGHGGSTSQDSPRVIRGTPVTVSEPAALGLVALGLVALAAAARRRRT